jgi:hypothetical protein
LTGYAAGDGLPFYISAVPVAACVVLMAMLVAKLMAGELAGV